MNFFSIILVKIQEILTNPHLHVCLSHWPAVCGSQGRCGCWWAGGGQEGPPDHSGLPGWDSQAWTACLRAPEFWRDRVGRLPTLSPGHGADFGLPQSRVGRKSHVELHSLWSPSYFPPHSENHSQIHVTSNWPLTSFFGVRFRSIPDIHVAAQLSPRSTQGIHLAKLRPSP